jgi:2-C-methyl-D-erythritol 4-phosphate cytidylyltransferase/2-C-methyl-D-erythritol 2,4-cyclodiphosphate synthase
MSCAAIIVAAGRSRRFGGSRAKQYVELSGRPLLAWTVEAFRATPSIDEIIVVVPNPEDHDTQRALAGLRETPCLRLCPGGDQRSDSVRRGLARVSPETRWIAIHDGVRPLITPALIERVLQRAKQHGAAVAAVPVDETVKRCADSGAGTVEATVERRGLFLAQTPQIFRRDLLEDAYQSLRPGQAVTDDAQVVEAAGYPVVLVAGEKSNIKITAPDDLQLAEAILRQREAALETSSARAIWPRVGIGYDVHAFVANRPLVLGGVVIPYTRGLAGHSDADVLSHAIGDALLGAAALGDLGQHFPAGRPETQGICSLLLLQQICRKLALAGFRPWQVDSVIACQEPRLGPYVEEMREKISTALELPVQQVGIKATTTEALGFVGRSEGLAAYATVTIIPD